MKHAIWSALNDLRHRAMGKDQVFGFLPHKFRHTQRRPYSYYNQPRWQNKAFKWLNPIIHPRQLFPYKMLARITKQKRHPHRQKRWAIYHWLQYNLNNK